MALTFAGIIGGYAVLHPLKSSIFLKFVGIKGVWFARMLTIVFIVPSMLLYTTVLHRLKRHGTTCFFLLFYAFFLLVSAGVLYLEPWHSSSYGELYNKLFGWFFYAILNFYSTFTAGTFWGYTNSISNPETAQKQYGYLIGIGRFVGILTALSASFFLSNSSLHETTTITLVLIGIACSLLSAFFCLYWLKKAIPQQYLLGYVDTHEEHRSDTQQKSSSLFQDLFLLVSNRYVFGIFGLVCSYELIYLILDYQLQLFVALQPNASISTMSCIFLENTAMVQGLTLVFAVFAVRPCLNYFGLRFCLLAVPVIIGACLVTFIFSQTFSTLFIITIIIYAINYGFNLPIRQIALIPTTEQIQFQSRAWIDSCGKTASKGVASSFGMFIEYYNPAATLLLNSWLALSIASGWIFIAHFIGKTYEKTIKTNSLIH